MNHVLPALLFCFTTLTAVTALASTGSVDPTFDAAPSIGLNSTSPLQNQLVQPDGKIVIWGGPLVADGIPKGDIVRLNVDGSLDTSFSYCNCALLGVKSLFLLPDGKFLAGGIGASFVAKIVRLNADGSVDSSFSYVNPPEDIGASSIRIIAIQADGRFFAARDGHSQGYNDLGLYRFNADGSVDAGFTRIYFQPARFSHPSFTGLIVLSDGKFYLSTTVSGAFSSFGTVVKYNANGTQDTSWQSPSFTDPNNLVVVSGIDLEADGSLIAAGDFTSVNGVSRADIVRILPAGNVDMGFNAPTFISASRVKVLPSGKILATVLYDIQGLSRVIRLNTDGSQDKSFVMSPTIDTLLNAFIVDPLSDILFLARIGNEARFVRLDGSGGRDPSFDPNVMRFGQIYALARQTDGKIIAAGVFTQFNGADRRSIVRVNPNGTLDMTFDAGTGFNSPPAKILIQTDGKILAIGSFASYDGDAVQGIVRINADGSRDTTFNVTHAGTLGTTIYGMSLQTDGKILISGNFTSVNGTNRTYVARLYPDGTLEPTFSPTLGCCNVNVIEAQADGRIMIGGGFSGVNGFNRSGIARLNADGSLDQSFLATNAGSVGTILFYPGGKYLIGLSRLNNDGSRDTSFVPPSFAASSSSDLAFTSFLVEPDGSVLVGGRFDTVGGLPRRNIVRLGPNGALDVLFLQLGTDGIIRTMLDDSSNKVMVGGDLTRVENSLKDAVARINVPPFTNKTPFDFDGDGRADVTVYRPSSGLWYQLFTNGSGYAAPQFGISGDVPVPADFDGDGTTDVAIWRPSTGDWWYRSSINGALITAHWGSTGDIPLASDFDGDGRADPIVYRPSTAQWHRLGSSVGGQFPFTFGQPGDVPLIGDFDGDGRSDMAVFRPSTGTWWWAASGSGNAFRAFHWGQSGDIAVPADYDGDGKTDFAVFRPTEGGWYIGLTSNGSAITLAYGLNGDRPVAADYDGDGKADIAVYRPSNGIWYLLQSTLGSGGVQWGVATDVAVPGAFLP